VAEPNSYSGRWFEFFHVGVDEGRTNQETMFVSSCAPLPDFRRVLDVCCGLSRHARALSKLGYSVVGVDRDADIISQARELGGGPEYVVADIRDYAPEHGAFDVAITMSQSFGYFDAPTNRDVLARLANGVRKGGRVIVSRLLPQRSTATSRLYRPCRSPQSLHSRSMESGIFCCSPKRTRPEYVARERSRK
jgi:SAM-dependent methyltransferase